MDNTAKFLNLTFKRDFFSKDHYHCLDLGLIISLEFSPAWEEPHGSHQNHDARWSAYIKELTISSSGKTPEEALFALKAKILAINSNLSKLATFIN